VLNHVLFEQSLKLKAENEFWDVDGKVCENEHHFHEEENMKIVKMSEVPKEQYVAPLFTSPDVSRQSLVSDSKDLRVSIVNFGKGVRNKFHTHDGDQVLIVTAGKGFVATEKEKKLVTAGEVVLFPAGEKHWHGATEDSDFSHIVVTKVGVKMTQLEK
jgi:quercetin dioxygenase-like cupin family protein